MTTKLTEETRAIYFLWRNVLGDLRLGAMLADPEQRPDLIESMRAVPRLVSDSGALPESRPS